MALEDFTKTWKVLPSPPPMGEEAGHMIHIKVIVPEDGIVSIECTDNAGDHAFHLGRYRQASDRIVGSDFKITIDKTVMPHTITCSPLGASPPPGSWTAEDSSGPGGGD